MTGLRLKLTLGFGSLFAVLLATGILALGLLARYSGTLDRIFRENYDSVRYGQQMREALEEMERLRAPGDSAERERAARNFDAALAKERGNITVAGEARVVDSLALLWDASRRRIAVPGEISAPLRHVEARLAALAQEVVDVNFRNILSVDGQVRRNAQGARSALLLLLAGGGLLFLGLSLAVTAWIVRPVAALTESVREIGRGNLDLVLSVSSRDEFGELAEAFNAMAGRLREVRRSDRQRLWRVHRATQNAIDSLPDAVAVVSPSGEIEMGNAAARRLFGLEAGRRLAELLDGRLQDVFREALETGHPVVVHRFADALQVFDEGERFFLPRALPVLSEGGVAGVTLVLADVTQLRRMDEMKDGVLAVVAHELRTPVTSLRMASHLLLDERLGSLSLRQEELAAGLREDSERMWRVVEELLEAGRLEVGGKGEFAAQEVGELAKTAVERSREAFHEKGVALDLELEPGIPPARLDAVRILLALGNLLSNALRHTPPGGHVLLRVVATGNELCLAVEDDGSGIAPEHVPHLFERFYRVPGQEGGSGVGLGLYIVREAARAHGGEASVASVPGQGSRFALRLPLQARSSERLGESPAT